MNKILKISNMKWKFLMVFPMALILFFSCKKQETPAPAPQYSTLLLHIHSNIDTSEIEVNKPYRNSGGRMISISDARIYISNIKAVKSDGTIIPVKGTVLLKTIDQEEFNAGQIPAGNYKTIIFDIGIDTPTNHISPAIYPVTNPLSMQYPSMWTGDVSKGYIFLNINGMIDSSVSMYGAVNYPFSYQVATDALLQKVTMPEQAFSVLPGNAHIVHLVIDYGKLFNGIDIKKQNKTTTFDDYGTAAAIAKNIPAMFMYESM
jgi:hypothetical protein